MEAHYGVVQQNGVWTIIGRGLRFGSYRTRTSAENAARRLAVKSALPVQLHIQDETGVLLPPTEIS
jgi:hypothetical protein